MRIRCLCGYVIPDYYFPSPYEGQILKDQEWDSFWDGIITEVRQFIQAVYEGRRREWIDKQYGLEYSTTDLDDGDVLFDLMNSFEFKYMVKVFECENCGRILIQKADKTFAFYKPDDDVNHHILTAEIDSNLE